MGILSGLKSLFSSSQESTTEAAEAFEYNGYVITPTPTKEGSQFRVAAKITKGEGEEQKVHNFIRSDLIPSHDECVEITVRKTKLTIDQLGDRIFG